MKTLQNNIKEVLEKDFTRTWDIISDITEGIKLDKTDTESRVAAQLTNAIGRWADARLYAYKALSDVSRSAERTMENLKNNFIVDSSFFDAGRFGYYLNEAKMFEQEIASMLFVVGVSSANRSLIFEKISATIEWN
jgi:hypothetical protein